MLWAAFFLVWALLFLELFNLTRWNWNETHNQNFATFTNAVLMLCVFSVGSAGLLKPAYKADDLCSEGWNGFMHD